MFATRTTSLFVYLATGFVSSVYGQCYRNTTEILVQQTLTTADERKVYRLCPNTVYQLGPTTTPGKQSPLVARSNTHFLCGADGSSANNCVLSGGESQFLSNAAIFEGENVATAVVVQGITFENALHVAILLEQAGEVTFIDCIIRNQVNAAPVLANLSPVRRGLVASGEFDGENDANSPSLLIRGRTDQRQTQQVTGNGQQLNVNFIDCRFGGNRQRNPPALFTHGVITVASPNHNLNVRNCVFVDNDYSTGNMGYIIRSYGAPVQIYDSCFRDNMLKAGSFGAVQVYSVDDTSSAFETEDNFGSHRGGEAADETICSFAAVSETIPELGRQATCFPFDGNVCPEEPPETKPDDASPPLLPAPQPLPPPTMSPPTTITSAPTLQGPLETPDDASQHLSLTPTKPPTIVSIVIPDNNGSSYKKPTGSARSMTTSNDYDHKRGKMSSSTSTSTRDYNNSKGRSGSSDSYSKGSQGMRNHVKSGSKNSVMTSSMMMKSSSSSSAAKSGKGEGRHYRYKSKKMHSSSGSTMKMKIGSASHSSLSKSQQHQEQLQKKKQKEFY